MVSAEQSVKGYWLHILRNGVGEPYTFTFLLSYGPGRGGPGQAGAMPAVSNLALSNVEARLEAIGMSRDRIESIKAQVLSSGETVGSVELDATGLSHLGFSL